MLALRGAFAGTLFTLLAVSHSSAAYPAFSSVAQVAPPSNLTGGIYESNPSIATNGTDFFVAWSNEGTVNCARVTAADVLLDSPSVPLSLTGSNPQAFWDGTKYLVVSSGRGQRVDPTTGAIDPAFTLQGAQAAGVAAVGAGEIFDVWQAAGGTLEGAVFDFTGAATSATVALPSGAVEAPSFGIANWGVAATSGQFLVGWINTATAVAAARVSTTGTLVDTTPLVFVAASDAGIRAPAGINVAGSPGQYLVSWLSGESLPHDYSARISPSQGIADPGGVYMNGSLGWPGAPAAAAWDGTEWWIVDLTTPLAQTLGSTGSPSDPVKEDYFVSAIAANPGARLAVNAEQDSIVALGLTPTGAGTPTTGVDVSSYPSGQSLLCTAASSAGYLVVWTETQSAYSRAAYGMRFALDGAPIDASPFALGADGGSACGAIGGTYFFGGTDPIDYVHFLGDIRSIPTTGALAITKNAIVPTGDAGTAGMEQETPLAMSCLSDRCLLVASEVGVSTVTWATIFGAAGNVILPPTTIAGESEALAVANDGSAFLVFQTPNVEGAMPSAVAFSPSGAESTVTLSNPALVPYAAGGGAGGFLGAGTTGLTWFNEQATMLGGAEALPSSAGSVGGVVWDGTAFFVGAGSSTLAPVGMEIPATPYEPEAGAPSITTHPLFPTADGAPATASDGAGHVLALAVQPSGSFATPLLFARFGKPGPNIVDAGTDGGDAGDGGAPGDGGTLGESDGSAGDAAAADGSSSSGDDAGAIADASASSMLDAGPSAPADGGVSQDAAIGGGGTSSGCGCATAGAGGLGYSGGWIALAALVALRRRHRGSGQRSVG